MIIMQSNIEDINNLKESFKRIYNIDLTIKNTEYSYKFYLIYGDNRIMVDYNVLIDIQRDLIRCEFDIDFMVYVCDKIYKLLIK